MTRRELMAALLSAPIVATAGQEKEPFTITDNVRLVLLDVSVMDKTGGYVTGLTKDDFTVFDAGHPTHISQFANVDLPVTVGLILDLSGSMRSKRPGVVLAGLAFAKQSNPQDEFFVVNFNDHVAPGLPAGVAFTDNLEKLHQALYMGESAGKTALYDAIAYGLRHLENGHHEKRTLIVVSDGGDNASHISQKETVALIEESRATIYTVGLLDPDNRDLHPEVLRRFSNTSGGQNFEPERIDDVIGVLARISKDIRSRYSIGFTPDSSANKNARRSIKVTANREGRKLIVRARSSYIV